VCVSVAALQTFAKTIQAQTIDTNYMEQKYTVRKAWHLLKIMPKSIEDGTFKPPSKNCIFIQSIEIQNLDIIYFQ